MSVLSIRLNQLQSLIKLSRYLSVSVSLIEKSDLKIYFQRNLLTLMIKVPYVYSIRTLTYSNSKLDRMDEIHLFNPLTIGLSSIKLHSMTSSRHDK